MIKAVMESRGDGPPVLLIGLSRRNCERLLAGDPIIFDTSVLPPLGVGLTGPPIVAIVADETEADIQAGLQRWINDETQIHDQTGPSSES